MSYTPQCQAALESARMLGAEVHGKEVHPLHLMLGVTQGPPGRWAAALNSLGVDPSAIGEGLLPFTGEAQHSADPESLSYSESAKAALTSALRVCRDLGVFRVGCEHVFVGAMEHMPEKEREYLTGLGLTVTTYLDAIRDLPSAE